MSAPENVPITRATAAVEPHDEIQSLQPTMNPAYSPSGERIVFAGAPEGRSAGIWTVHPDGSHR